MNINRFVDIAILIQFWFFCIVHNGDLLIHAIVCIHGVIFLTSILNLVEYNFFN